MSYEPRHALVNGAKIDPTREHPVLDLAHWRRVLPTCPPVGTPMAVNGPLDMAWLEEMRLRAREHGDLGPSVPADAFVWSTRALRDAPRWLTRIGGYPWRERDEPWPEDVNGLPLKFLGQVCFADSRDILPFEIPGDVLLFFGRYNSGHAYVDEDNYIEWSDVQLRNPPRSGVQSAEHGQLPCELYGVMHRTVHYTDPKVYKPVFKAAGLEEEARYASAFQATMISRDGNFPQGQPFDDDDPRVILCTLSSVAFHGAWPMCDVPTANISVYADGSQNEYFNNADALGLVIADAGCLYVFRDEEGEFDVYGAW